MSAGDNDIRIVVDAENRTATAFGAATKGAKAVGDGADKASDQLKKMERSAEDAAAKARKLALAEEAAAAKTRDLADKVQRLQREIAATGDESGDLTRKLDRLQIAVRVSANATDDYRRSANRAAGDARELARAYDRVADNARQAARAVAMLAAANALPGNGGRRGGGILGMLGRLGSGALSLGGKAGGAALGGLESIGGAAAGLAGGGTGGAIAVGVGAAAAVPAAAFAGGVAGGAALLGAGAAGAGAGLAGAWMGDPVKYQAMWDKAINGIQRRWLDSSAQFGPELTQGLKEVDRVLRDLPVERILNATKGLSGPLISGLGGGLSAAADGFAELAEKSDVVVNKVGPKLASFGNDVGDSLRAISYGSEGGAAALGDLVDAAGYAVKGIGIMIMGFEQSYLQIRNFATGLQDATYSIPLFGGVVQSAADSLYHVESNTMTAGRALHGVEERFTDAGAAARYAAAGAISFNDAVTETRNIALGMADANIALAQGWFDLGEELKNGKKSLDLNTTAGIDNQKAIVSQIKLAEQAREQQIELSGPNGIGAANEAYAANVERIRAAAVAAGFNATKVQELIDKYAGVPPVVKTDVQTPGLPTAVADGISLGNALNNISGSYYAHVYVAVSAPPGISLGNLQHHAFGGVTSGGTSVINDWGAGGATQAGYGGDLAGLGELVHAPNGSTIIPAGSGRAMMRDLATGGGGRGGGGGGVTGYRHEFVFSGSGALWEAMHQAQRAGDLQIFTTAIVNA